MKRRGNVISPIESINTIVEMLIQTDYSVEDGEIVWVKSEQTLFVYRVNSGLVPDNVNVVASLYGNGVWQRLSVQAGSAELFLNTIAAGAAGSGRLIDADPQGLKTGAQAWTESIGGMWTWEGTSVLTADNITVVNPTLNGVNPGRFLRNAVPASRFQAQGTWFVDQTNGNDEFDGTVQVFTAGLNGPIKTYDEYVRRCAANGVIHLPNALTVTVNQVGNYVGNGTAVSGFCDVILEFSSQFQAQWKLQGVLPAASFTGTLSANTNVTRGATGSPGTFCDATSTWNPTTELGRLVHNITRNSFTWIAADGTGNRAILSPWFANSQLELFAMSNDVGQNGNSVETFVLPQIDGLQITIIGSASQNCAIIGNLDVQNAQMNSRLTATGSSIILKNCLIRNPQSLCQIGSVFLNTCQLLGGTNQIILGEKSAGSLVCNGGLWRDMPGQAQVLKASNLRFSTFTLLQNSRLIVKELSVLSIGDVQLRGMPSTPVTLQSGAMMTVGAGYTQGAAAGNTGAGLTMNRGTSLRYTSGAAFSVNGGSDFAFQAATQAFAWDDANHVYTAAKRNLTWTLLQTTFGGGGFGDSLFDPLTLCTACLDS